MNSAGTGAKAGTVAGVVYGLIDAVFGVLSLVIFKPEIMSALSRLLAQNNAAGLFSAGSLYSIALVTTPVASFVGGIIIGLILGTIFGAFFDKIPGGSELRKGLIFGAILWLIFDLGIGALTLLEYGALAYAFDLGTSVAAVLVFVYLMSTLYNKWLPREGISGEVDSGIQSG